jgi:hypothetical protein
MHHLDVTLWDQLVTESKLDSTRDGFEWRRDSDWWSSQKRRTWRLPPEIRATLVSDYIRSWPHFFSSPSHSNTPTGSPSATICRIRLCTQWQQAMPVVHNRWEISLSDAVIHSMMLFWYRSPPAGGTLGWSHTGNSAPHYCRPVTNAASRSSTGAFYLFK